MADLGNKHLCYKCSAKFYDLKKPKPLCPKCGADQADAPPVVVAPPPPPPKRPRVVQAVDPTPVEEPEPVDPEDAEAAAASAEDEDEEKEAVPDEELDEPKGEDSYD